jgi:hypothetical protein
MPGKGGDLAGEQEYIAASSLGDTVRGGCGVAYLIPLPAAGEMTRARAQSETN